MTKILVTYDMFREGFTELESKYDVTFPEGRDFTYEEVFKMIPEYDVLCSMFDFPVNKDSLALEFLEKNKEEPYILAMQAEGREWMKLISKPVRNKFAYSFTDGMTETIVTAGDALPEVVLTGENAETGKRLVGWVVNNGGEYSFAKADEFVMPQADVEITPYVTLGWEYYKEYGGGVLDLSEDKTIVAPGDQNFNQSFVSNITVDSASISGRYVISGDKVGTEYSFTGQTGEYFRLVRACTVRPNTMRTISYRIRNNGEEAVSFTAYQVNSGANTDGAPSSGSITLQPNEEKTFDLSFAYNNENVMLLITLDADATNARIWVSAEISD